MANDEFALLYGAGSAMSWPATKAVAVTPHDTNDLAEIPRALYIGVTGDVKVDMQHEGTVTFKAAPVGILAIRVTRVYSTGTAATDILAIR